jgi:hypothetical protein
VRNDTFRVFTIHLPPEIARSDTVLGQAPHLGSQPPDSGITARLVHVVDANGGHLACGPPLNGAQLLGQIALIQRGECGFGVKARNVEDAGAVAFVVYQDDRVPDTNCDAVLMAWEEPFVSITGAFLPRCVAVPILPTVISGAEIMATLAPFFESPNPSTEEAPDVGGYTLLVVPNPSSSVTTLSANLSALLHSRVEVYDSLGRRVALLYDGAMAAGEHRFQLDVSGLAPGVYVFQVATAVNRLGQRFIVGR